MLSSISSSEPLPEAPARSKASFSPSRLVASSSAADRVPVGLSHAWAMAIVGAFIVLAALECSFRAMGYVPMLEDDRQLWASVRRGMRADDPSQIALVGTSRTQMDFDLHTFSHDMGGAPVAQLAISGSDGMLVLEDLSKDVHFRGLLVLDVVPWNVFAKHNEHDQLSIDFVAYYARPQWLSPIEDRLSAAVHGTFLFRSVSIRNLFRDLVKLRRPVPSPFTLDPDRSQHVDWSRVPIETLNEPLRHLTIAGTFASPQHLQENLVALEAMIRRIQSRGGRVALVCLPSTGSVGAAERLACPRERYWDILAATTSAVTLNWMDDPRLSIFQCPDGSHLDMRDQGAFTRIVVEDLREKLGSQHWMP